MVYNPSKRDLNIALMELETLEDGPAAKAGREAGQNFLAMMKERESPKVFTFEQIKAAEKVTLQSGKEVVLFTFGHNYGPALQPNFRSLTKMECVELCLTPLNMPLLPVFILDASGQYFIYSRDNKDFSFLDPRQSLSKAYEGRSVVLQSDLPYWHHCICYLPQIRLVT